MPFSAVDIEDVTRVRAVMAAMGPDRHVADVFDLRDDEDESLMSIALKAMSIEVVVGRTPPAKARSFVGMFRLFGDELPAVFQAVMDAVAFVEGERP
jgi:hypothetical protein